MDLLTGLKLIQHILIKSNIIKADQAVPVFIGIDEYHQIPGNPNEIIALLLNISMILSFNRKIHLYPMLAGTEWSKLDGPGSSNEFCVRITVPLLCYRASLQVARDIFPSRYRNEHFRNCLLVTTGQNFRAFIQFLRDCENNYTDNNFRIDRATICSLASSGASRRFSKYKVQ
jgi:hypothetical protein